MIVIVMVAGDEPFNSIAEKKKTEKCEEYTALLSRNVPFILRRTAGIACQNVNRKREINWNTSKWCVRTLALPTDRSLRGCRESREMERGMIADKNRQRERR